MVPLKWAQKMEIQVACNLPERASMVEEPLNNHMDKIILPIAVILSFFFFN